MEIFTSFKPQIGMGRVRTKTAKKAARVIIEKYYTKLTLDFKTDKKIIERITVIHSKPLRIRIASYITHLMKTTDYGRSVNSLHKGINQRNLKSFGRMWQTNT